MQTNPHVNSLKTRHSELESKLDEMRLSVSTDDLEFKKLKLEKLQIKDRIEALNK